MILHSPDSKPTDKDRIDIAYNSNHGIMING